MSCSNWLFLEDTQLKIRGVWDNKLKSHKVSLNIEGEFASEPELLKSQHLALVKFVEKEDNKDWQKNLKEYPAHVDAHDGIIDIGKKIYVFTKGTNEIYKIKNGVQITLFRTFQKVTGKNLAWRPTTSGLSWDESSVDSQLQKKLYFDFQISTKKLIPKYNEFKFQPYLYMVQNRNFIANKMNKFVLNNIIQKPQKQNTLSINNPNIFISGFQKKKKKLELRLVNLENKENELILVNNSRKIKIKFKKYEIKKIVLDAH